MTVFAARRASRTRHVLAEGPVWVPETSSLLWVDVEQGTVCEGGLAGAEIGLHRQLHFNGRVGAAVRGEDGSLLVATHDRLVVVAADGQRIDGPQLIADGVDGRSNDGACDPAGRFLIGTLALDDRVGSEFLYRLEHDGSLTVIDSDLTLSNGIAWSPGGTMMYSTDTGLGIIWVRDYDVETGDVGPRRQYLRIEDGYPDGICADSRGYLWVAIWGEGEVRSFTPAGVLADTVRVPAPHVSSVAFVGEHLDQLVITTASRDLGPDDVKLYPDAGCLFLAEVGATGVPTTPWSPTAIPTSHP